MVIAIKTEPERDDSRFDHCIFFSPLRARYSTYLFSASTFRDLLFCSVVVASCYANRNRLSKICWPRIRCLLHFQMASSVVPVSTSPSSTAANNQLASFIPCQYTLVATKATQHLLNESNNVNDIRRTVVPRVCRLRTRDNTMGIYAIADPIGNDMLASDVTINLLVEQLSTISFEDDSYKEKIDQTMQNMSYEIENRLLQMTFDHAEEKVISTTSSVSVAEKLLPALEEAESGAFLFAATVTQSNVYVTYVGAYFPSGRITHSRLVSFSRNDPSLSDQQSWWHVEHFRRSTSVLPQWVIAYDRQRRWDPSIERSRCQCESSANGGSG